MYTAKNFEHLLGTPGFSDTLLKNHFTLYEGYVKNTNALLEAFASGTPAAGTPAWAELRRRFGWEWNGMRLHELYFGNMIKEKKERGEHPLWKEVEKTWGSIDAWQKDLTAVASMRGIGWVLFVRDGEKLLNVWINEHDCGHLAGTQPLLVMDVFEHAFMIDYGLKRADYIAAFWNAVDWSVVEERATKSAM